MQDQEDAEALREETGWKLVHGDVFRVPPCGMLLSVVVATGWQLLTMCCVVLLMAALGFLAPGHRGALLQSVVLSLSIYIYIYICMYIHTYVYV